MQIEFNEKTSELKLTLSINPKSSQVSTSGKTYIVASDGGKFEAGNRQIRVQVNAFSPVEKAKKTSKK